MPLKEVTPEMWKRQFRRILLVGQPNSWKTSSLKTFPLPMAIISCPEEVGGASIPQIAGIDSWAFEREPKERAEQLIIALQKKVDEVIGNGKHDTLAIEGLHHLYDVMYEAEHEAVTDAYPSLDPEKAKWQTFGRADKRLMKFINQTNSSTIGHVVMTVWSAPQADDPLVAGSKQHMMPSIPGRFTPQNVVGCFGVVATCYPGVELAPGKFSEGTWQIRPRGNSWAGSLKLPVEISAKIPTVVPQDWSKLEAMVLGGTQ